MAGNFFSILKRECIYWQNLKNPKQARDWFYSGAPHLLGPLLPFVYVLYLGAVHLFRLWFLHSLGDMP